MRWAIKFKILFEIEFDLKKNHKIVVSFKVWPTVTIKIRAGHSPDALFLLLFRFWYIKRMRMEDRDVIFLVQNFH